MCSSHFLSKPEANDSLGHEEQKKRRGGGEGETEGKKIYLQLIPDILQKLQTDNICPLCPNILFTSQVLGIKETTAMQAMLLIAFYSGMRIHNKPINQIETDLCAGYMTYVRMYVYMSSVWTSAQVSLAL